MKGNTPIINALNGLLAFELAAMDQYFIHSEMYADWGLTKLYERIAHEFDDEKGHAKKLIERILFLEGKPDMVTRDGLNIGHDVPSMLQSDLDLVASLNQAINDEMQDDIINHPERIVILQNLQKAIKREERTIEELRKKIASGESTL